MIMYLLVPLLTTGACTINFMTIINSLPLKTEVLATVSHYHPGLKCGGKAGSLSVESSHIRVAFSAGSSFACIY